MNDPSPNGPPVWLRPVRVFALSLLALFAFGWWVGSRQLRTAAGDSPPSAMGLGLGRATYECAISSKPEGARIAVDGRPRGRFTPATLRFKPGSHTITLSVDSAGGAPFTVHGNALEQVSLDADLRGSHVVRPPADGTPVVVAVDGLDQGWAPVTIDYLTPGPHDLSFSVPGSPPSEEVVQVGVRQRSEITARSLVAPLNGEVEIHARLDASGATDTRAVEVWVDGRLQGRTPVILQLPRGPHSFRGAYQGARSAVQVIDLPGGNRRYVELAFDAGASPRLALTERPVRSRGGQDEIVGARLDGVEADDVADMWLYVRGPRGSWMRYPMTRTDRPGGVEGRVRVAHAPGIDLAYAPYYVCAVTATGDEYFTEIQHPVGRGPAAAVAGGP